MSRKLLILGILLVNGMSVRVRAQDLSGRDGIVLVSLRPAVTMGQGLVRLGDVADFQGGTTTQRGKLAKLDVAEFEGGRPNVLLTKEQVYFRLRIAGWDPGQFRVAGAATAVVHQGNAMAAPSANPAAGPQGNGSANAPVVLKARDPVRLLARIGSVQVTARGEAMEDGRLGQMVRVRNIDSSRIVSGRLMENNVVEVDY
jgi:flagellar basal body P-ring formation chaperone FlgA